MEDPNMTTQKILSSLIVLGGLSVLASGTALADEHQAMMTASQHAGLAAKSNDIAMVHKHLHHALNCLVGEGGEGFDAAAGNPCAKAGGAIPQAGDAKMKMKLEKVAKEARMGIADGDIEKAKKAAMMVQSELK
jgi:hypothetical protein